MQPSECDAVSAFKQQLGIHPSEEASFGWVAEVGLQSPLPPRWTSHTDTASGYVYYVDHDRQVSSWENPLVPFLRRVVEIGRNYQKQPSGGYFEEQKGLLWHQHKHELDCWHGPFTDDSGRQYYVNSTEGVSSWSDPRVDAQYIFELESGLLTSLEEVLNQADSPDTPGVGAANNGRHWKTADGADVLTLDSPGTGLASRPVTGRPDKADLLTTKAQWNAKEEHKSVLQRMSSTAARMHDMHQDDLEAQRLQVNQKVKARKQRQRLASTPEDVPVQPPTGSTVRIPQAPPMPGCAPPAPLAPARPAPPAPLDTEAGDIVTPQPPATDGFLPPPPPPPVDGGGVGLEPQPPSLSPRAEEDHGLDIFKPPSQMPSPTAGARPVLPPDVEQRLNISADKPEAFQGALLGAYELRTDGGGPATES